ncbi:MAG: hypothetical protein AAGE94_08260 [Acidobacteriota bacterium]
MTERPPLALKSILFVALAALVAAPTLAVGPLPFTTTHLVSGANLPLVNGANLLAAVAGAGPNTLIKLEPGFYDLGGGQINLPNFVDIEGSGRDITTIFSDLSASFTPTVINVAAGINGEIRELTVSAASAGPTGIRSESNELLLTEVNLEIESGDAGGIGVRIVNAESRLDEVFVRILGSTGNATGFLIEGGSPALTSCLFFASNVARNATGIALDDSTATIEGSILFSIFNGSNTGILVSGTATRATIRNTRGVIQGNRSTGIQVQKLSNARVKESSFQVRSDSSAVGINLEDGTAKVTESTFDVASLFTVSPNVWGALLGGSSNLDSNQSNYESTSFAVQNNGTGQARFGASQLIGAAVPAVLGPLVCIHAYNGVYTGLNNFCN